MKKCLPIFNQYKTDTWRSKARLTDIEKKQFIWMG